MDIIELKAFQGRNIYSHQKTIKMVVDLKNWIDTPTVEIENFNCSLLKILPGLEEHYCSPGYPGGFVVRLEKGTYLAHVIEHVALEVLNHLGDSVTFGKTRRIHNTTYYNIIYAYKNKIAGLEAGKISVQLIKSLCNRGVFDLTSALKYAKEKITKYELGPSTQAIAKAAEERGIPIIRIGDESILQLGYGKYQKRIEATITEDTSCIAVDMACNKGATKSLLLQVGIPVPEGGVCHSPQQAVNLAEEIGYPVVVKPQRGNQGKGVSLNLCTPDEVMEAFCTAAKFDNDILVEQHVLGNDYRVLIIDNRVAAVSRRLPAQIHGDGFHSIMELVDIANMDPQRGNGHEKPLTKIKIDDITIRLLGKQGYTLDSIPPKNQRVYLKANGNISTGGVAIDCTEKIHPANSEIAIRAARIIGLDIAGIDITCPDISRPILENGGAIIEVNAAPGLRMHLFPYKGKPRKVANAIVDMLFPAENKCSIPIISITGTNGKTTTTRAVAHILKAHGMNVGMTVTGGIYINDQCIMEGDATGPISATTVLMDKSIDVAVLETARGGIIRSGIAYDLSDVGVLTNLSEDHLGIDGIQTLDELLHVKALVVEAVKKEGYAVLNADDAMVVQTAERIRSNIIYFSRQEDNIIIHKHLSGGGIAIFLKNDYITIATGDSMVQSLHVSTIPATHKGKLYHNVENCLAAFSAAYAMKIPISTIEKALASFYSDELQNPGRFNVFNIRDFRIVVDYGHNAAGYKLVGEAVRQMGASRIIGIIGVPGDRTNTSILSIGKIAAEFFDKLIIKEDVDLRSREPGEVAKLLEQGALSQGMNRKQIDIIFSEPQALYKTMNEACPGDLIVIFYEKLDSVLETIKNFSNQIHHDVCLEKNHPSMVFEQKN